eukprot:scaffold47_cov112-Isochrysis_galbana.AAC.5
MDDGDPHVETCGGKHRMAVGKGSGGLELQGRDDDSAHRDYTKMPIRYDVCRAVAGGRGERGQADAIPMTCGHAMEGVFNRLRVQVGDERPAGVVRGAELPDHLVELVKRKDRILRVGAEVGHLRGAGEGFVFDVWRWTDSRWACGSSAPPHVCEVDAKERGEVDYDRVGGVCVGELAEKGLGERSEGSDAQGERSEGSDAQGGRRGELSSQARRGKASALVIDVWMAQRNGAGSKQGAPA